MNFIFATLYSKSDKIANRGSSCIEEMIKIAEKHKLDILNKEVWERSHQMGPAVEKIINDKNSDAADQFSYIFITLAKRPFLADIVSLDQPDVILSWLAHFLGIDYIETVFQQAKFWKKYWKKMKKEGKQLNNHKELIMIFFNNMFKVVTPTEEVFDLHNCLKDSDQEFDEHYDNRRNFGAAFISLVETMGTVSAFELLAHKR